MRRWRHVASHVRNVASHVRNIALQTGKYGARHSTADVWRASTVSFITVYSIIAMALVIEKNYNIWSRNMDLDQLINK